MKKSFRSPLAAAGLAALLLVVGACASHDAATDTTDTTDQVIQVTPASDAPGSDATFASADPMASSDSALSRSTVPMTSSVEETNLTTTTVETTTVPMTSSVQESTTTTTTTDDDDDEDETPARTRLRKD